MSSAEKVRHWGSYCKQYFQTVANNEFKYLQITTNGRFRQKGLPACFGTFYCDLLQP